VDFSTAFFRIFPPFLPDMAVKIAHNAIANSFSSRYNENIMGKYEHRSFQFSEK